MGQTKGGDPLVEAWVLTAVVGIAVTVVGWLVSRMTTQNELIRTQRETIDVLKRHNDRLEVAAEVTERVLNSLPQPRAPGGKR